MLTLPSLHLHSSMTTILPMTWIIHRSDLEMMMPMPPDLHLHRTMTTILLPDTMTLIPRLLLDCLQTDQIMLDTIPNININLSVSMEDGNHHQLQQVGTILNTAILNTPGVMNTDMMTALTSKVLRICRVNRTRKNRAHA